MYIALSLMFLGIFIGKGLRHSIKFSLSPYIMVVICLLLAVLGVELGFNKELISKFAGIGAGATVIAVLAVFGSCIAAMLFGKFVRNGIEKKIENNNITAKR